MTFAEVEKKALELLGDQYVSFTWESHHYSVGHRVRTECVIYREMGEPHFFRGATWESALLRLDEHLNPGKYTQEPPTEEAEAANG